MIVGIDINEDAIYKLENKCIIIKDFELSTIARVLDITETDFLKEFNNKLGQSE